MDEHKAIKPGVMLYFDAMENALKALDNTELGALTRAVLEYANPTNGAEPDFKMGTPLWFLWGPIKKSIDRDGETYERKKRSTRYGGYVTSCKKQGLEPLDRKAWEAAGMPNAATGTETSRGDKPGTDGGQKPGPDGGRARGTDSGLPAMLSVEEMRRQDRQKPRKP